MFNKPICCLLVLLSLVFANHELLANTYVVERGYVVEHGYVVEYGDAVGRGHAVKSLENAVRPVQSNQRRSRSDVIREVKQRYNAEVLRISYDERREVYRVRVLMPNGKVRNLTISARK